jgi:hypothetical protein
MDNKAVGHYSIVPGLQGSKVPIIQIPNSKIQNPNSKQIQNSKFQN